MAEQYTPRETGVEVGSFLHKYYQEMLQNEMVNKPSKDRGKEKIQQIRLNNSDFIVKHKETTNENDPVDSTAHKLTFFKNNIKVGEIFVSVITTDKAFIYNFEIAEKYRGKGYGTEILKWVMSQYQVNELIVDKTNTRAIHLYQKLGFKKGVEFIEDGGRRIVMKIDLNEQTTVPVTGKLYPVYITLFSNNTKFGYLIKKATKSEYTHATVSLDVTMNNMYSFSSIPFSTEKWFSACSFGRESIWAPGYVHNKFFHVFVTFVDKEGRDKIAAKIKSFIDHAERYQYNVPGLIQCYLRFKDTNKPDETKKIRWFCSEFVATVINSSDEVEGFDNILVSPNELANKPNVLDLGKYTIDDFDEKILVHKTNQAEKIFRNKSTIEAIPMSESVLTENTIGKLFQSNKINTRHKTLQRYNFDIDWKRLNDKFVELFPKNNPLSRFDLINVFMTYVIIPTKIAPKLVTEKLIELMTGLSNIIKTGYIKIIDVVSALISFVDADGFDKVIKYPEKTLVESIMSSHLITSYKSAGEKKLSGFRRTNLTPEFIKNNKNTYPFLKHVRTSSDTKGVVWFDKDVPVACVVVRKVSDDLTWITSLDVFPDYRGYGLGKQVLDYAVRKMMANSLTVAHDNEIAKKMYSDYGFREMRSNNQSNKVIYMTIRRLSESINDALIERPYKPSFYYLYQAIDTIFGHNELIRVWGPSNDNYSDLLWQGEAWKAPEEIRVLPIQSISGIIPEKLTESDYINLTVCADADESSWIEFVKHENAILDEFMQTSQISSREERDAAMAKYGLRRGGYGQRTKEEDEERLRKSYDWESRVPKKQQKKIYRETSSLSEDSSNLAVRSDRGYHKVKKIVDTLNDKELHYICSGEFKDSTRVVYRKVKTEKGTPVAFIDCYRWAPGIGKIVLATNSEYRGKGYAKILVNGLVKSAKDLGLDTLIWEYDSDNLASGKLGKSFGFKETNKTKETITLEKKITESITSEHLSEKPSRRDEYVEEDEIFRVDENLSEGVIFGQKDIEINLNKWTRKPGKNILFITGLSGSGKTTLAEKYEKEYNAHMFELDGLEHRYDTSGSAHVLDKVRDKYPEYDEYYKDTSRKALDSVNVLWNAADTALDIMEKDSKNLYIVEGVQLYDGIYKDQQLKNKPLIIKNTSHVTSVIRSLKRAANADSISLSQAIHDNLMTILQYHRNSYKPFRKFKQRMTETTVVDDDTKGDDNNFHKGNKAIHWYDGWTSDGCQFDLEGAVDPGEEYAYRVEVDINQGDKWPNTINNLNRADKPLLAEGAARVLVDPTNKDMVNKYINLGYNFIPGIRNRGRAQPMFKVDITPNDRLYAVYVVLFYSNTLISKAIRAAAGPHFSHAALSLDPHLNTMYSFGKKNGLHIEGFIQDSIRDDSYQKNNTSYAIYQVCVTADQYDNMKKRLEWFANNKTKFKYNFAGLFKNYLGISDNPENRYFCSQFVADILNAGAEEKKYFVDPSLVTPETYVNATFTQYVTSGAVSEFNGKEVEHISKLLKARETKKRNSLTESAPLKFPEPFIIKFDKYGIALVTATHVKHLEQMFSDCVNADPLLPEHMFKLYYAINIIDHYLSKGQDKRSKNYQDIFTIREKMLVVLPNMIEAYTKEHPDFSFQSSYENSPYKDLPILSSIMGTEYRTLL